MKRLLAIALLILPVGHAAAGEGHEAGYQWAAENNIEDPANCYDEGGGPINNSESFTEGCLEYLQDNGLTNDDDVIEEDEADGNVDG